jgi:hypothetical protein
MILFGDLIQFYISYDENKLNIIIEKYDFVHWLI